MLIERELSEHDLSLLAQIDRSERVEANYRLENGALILYPVHVDMRGWPEGEAEENALVLEKCLRRGGWLYGAFDGQALVAAVVVDNRVIHNQGLNMRQLTFLHISRDYRGQGLGAKLFALACEQGRRFGAEALYVSATESRNTVEFYQRQGCRLVDQPDPELFALEPRDIHLYLPLT
ncbi:GNAT family N-acetyltransferase [Pseudomonas moraviensis]|uniref:GNAT family N-acetyltransferase n=1 Tax=Pseudomonas moraviensis TaxID=321662 RepID=A0A2A2PJ80_9PSED|nr:GNAT family N-acetyltransferase [Pseudomonas moraviensis]PAW50788.1 GNAT family N-acetyltransferase [Pseudomonas moraviensis]PAW55295.1 GNAT family N-acetyltransferase [Pseudomonas moraviensis]